MHGHERVACAAFAQIYWSSHDTEKTVRQIKQHNAVWTTLWRIT
jgi:hypothetical protein